MLKRTKVLAVVLAITVGLGALLTWRVIGASSEARATANSAELQRLSTLLGIQFAETTELVLHGDGDDRAQKYYHWFLRDLSGHGELRGRFAKLGTEMPAALGTETAVETARKVVSVQGNVPKSESSSAYWYDWTTSGTGYQVTLYMTDGSEWVKIASFK